MKLKKCVAIFALILAISLCLCVVSNAYTLDPKTAMTAMQEDASTAEGSETIKPVINAIIGTIQVAGTGIALIMVSVLGIKYMLAAPNEKADVKKQITPMVIGAIILFGAVNIIQIIATFTADTFK